MKPTLDNSRDRLSDLIVAGAPPEPPAPGYDLRFGRFPNLMPLRIEEILLVSSPYDAFILEEDGLLTELIFSEYTDLGLTHAPRVTRVSSGEDALAAIRNGRFDLVITMLRLGDMDIVKFGEAVRELDPVLPIVLLVANELELARLEGKRHIVNVDSIYVWHGDAKLFLAIIKSIEDRWNVEHDTQVGGIGVMILIEDSVRFRSSILPIMYSELVSQTRSVMAEGINRMHRTLRLRARPKVVVAESYEEGMHLYEAYKEYLFGIITDVSFARRGVQDPGAGIDFIRTIKASNPDVPCLLQSSDPANRALAYAVGAEFLHKRSTTLLQDVRAFMLTNFGFGDFVFRMPDGQEVARAADLRTLTGILAHIPLESLEFHASRNHFSNWLRARTEFDLARQLRPRTVAEFKDLEALRRYLLSAFEDALREHRRGAIEDFSRGTFDARTRFARIGGGSLGGKARGLAFMDALLVRHQLNREFEGVRVFVPRSVVIGSDVFDQFIDRNELRALGLHNTDDASLRQAFLASPLPHDVVDDLHAFLSVVRYPIAIRSSSLLEDSLYYPFAGVYDTRMIANNDPDDGVRLRQLCDAIKLVFASTFHCEARRYLDLTPYRIEEQKMAVILQQLVGTQHERYFYPSFAGVVRSYNFYPFGQMRPEDGVASVALGLGKEVVEGREALRFCPAHPHVLPQMANVKQFLTGSQKSFYAIDLQHSHASGADMVEPIVSLGLDAAERHGTLAQVGSVWSPDDECFYDGIYRPGARVVTFAHILKADLFPLAPILRRVLEIGREGMAGPVEIEFACNNRGDTREFGVLQIRPYAASTSHQQVDVDNVPTDQLVCRSEQALGNGVIDGVRDILYVRPDRFDAGRTPEIARQVASLNESIRAAGRFCLLIGPGRWGSSNPWLGIPVTWAQICASRVIVETSLDNFSVDPSQGSHFFQNLTSAGVAYLTINPRGQSGFIDWAWLDDRPAEQETELVRHVRLDWPLEIRIDGRRMRACVLKHTTRAVPGASPSAAADELATTGR